MWLVKRLLAVGSAALLIAIVVLAFQSGSCGNRVDTSNPESVARAAITSIPSYDPEIVCSYFAGSAYGQMYEGLVDFYSTNSDIRVDNVVVGLTSVEENIAYLYIAYDLNWTFFDYEETRHITRDIRAINQNGAWYLNSTI